MRGTGEWRAIGTVGIGDNRPIPGRLVAFRHGVYKVEAVEFLALDDDDRDVWLSWGTPDIESWARRPYTATLRYVAGWHPSVPDGKEWDGLATITVRAKHHARWMHYPVSGRWPMCSCCGEPMPCRAELEDRQVTASLDRIADLESKLPGCCWACSEPISSRHQAVHYEGENIDLPGAHSPDFHLRAKCFGAAKRYEERWVAVDPRRERIITYPKCRGSLIVHHDGSTECTNGEAPFFGVEMSTQSDCRGHETHDHSVFIACFTEGPCPRGCKRDGHRGAMPKPRPKLRASQQEPIPGASERSLS